jgi:DNA-binding GntR family transcriptional regulator
LAKSQKQHCGSASDAIIGLLAKRSDLDMPSDESKTFIQDRATPAPLYEVIYAVLRDHLVGQRLSPGLVLSESNVARAFNASRVPVRAALRRLHAEGLINEFKGRGYLAGSGDLLPIRMDLNEAGFQLPQLLATQLAARNRWEHIYPTVEHAIAICLAFGRFMINETTLAEHFSVSRTVAHEVLAKLERTGIVIRDQNQRWYAGPLTAKNIREHFQIRWLLEPVALRQAFSRLDKRDLERTRDELVAASDGQLSPEALQNIEQQLHVELISHCDNELLLETVMRSQLPLFAAHSAFHRYQRKAEIEGMVSDHAAILDLLMVGRLEPAASLLESHIKRALQTSIGIWEQLGDIPEEMLPNYMTPMTQR